MGENARTRREVKIKEEERREKQDIIINITLYSDLKKPCFTDNIEDTVDYKKIKKSIRQFLKII